MASELTATEPFLARVGTDRERFVRDHFDEEGGMKTAMVFALMLLGVTVVLGSGLPARGESPDPELTALLRELRVQRPRTAMPAPPFSLPDLNGAQVDLARLQGRVVMLYFWTTT